MTRRWFAIACLIVGCALSIGIRLTHAADLPLPTQVVPFRCLDINGKVIGNANGYQRYGTAYAACWNLPDGFFVDGGRERLNKSVIAAPPPVVPPAPPPTASGGATLSWTPPTAYTDGSALTVTSYRVLYGTTPSNLTQSVTATGAQTTATVSGLAVGIWYFAVRAIDAQGRESDLSNVASKTI